MKSLFELDVPQGWTSAPLWTIATRKDRKGFPDAELLSVYREYGVIKKSDRDDNHNVASEDLSAYKLVKKGDLVLNKMKTWQGSLGVSDFDGIVSPAYYTCELSNKIHPKFIHFLMRSKQYVAMYGAASKGIRVGQWDLPYEELREIPVLLPPKDVQLTIATYLQSETRQIDFVISKKLETLRLLEEYLEATVSEILESVSEKVKLKYRFAITNGNSVSADFINDHNLESVSGLPFVATKEVGFDGTVNYETEIRIPEYLLHNFRIAKPGTIFLCSEGGSAGRKFGLNTELTTFGNKLFGLTPKQSLSEKFLYFIFLSRDFQNQFKLGMNGMIGGVSSGSLGEILIPDASAQEEAELLPVLKSKYEMIQSIIEKIELSISLVNDYRSSLFTCVTTGQIDVSDLKGNFS